MKGGLYKLARPLIFKLDPETAHTLSLEALKRGLGPRPNIPVDRRLSTKVAGLSFPNPLGLAAGYDKDAEVPAEMLRLGFGFVEVGTVTPQPQAGNARPRIFRLEGRKAIINRLGFNNGGHADAFERLAARAGKPGIVGVNIGANKDSEDRIADYVEGVHRFEGVANYLTVNISSPNTPGLRALQSGAELDRLLAAVVAARNGVAAITATERKPLFVKVAPDLSEEEIGAIADAVRRHAVDGLIVSNTTLSRKGVEAEIQGGETGGLSGQPLFDRSTYVLASFRRAVGPKLPLIGVGGVDGPASALAKIEAGADLVQLYTGLVYAGPELPVKILKGMLRYLDSRSIDSIADLRDRSVGAVLEKGPPPA